MWSGIKRRFEKAVFNRQCAGIYKTPPVSCDRQSKVVVVSQLHHPDVTMYLLAAKSFARYVRPRRFTLVDDGLNEHDKQQLIEHLGEVDFTASSAVSMNGLPRGGTWERLATLSEKNKSAYVVQLDADVLTLNRPDEVIDCIAANRSFTLGTGSGRRLVAFAEASRFAAANPSPHVQNQAEQALARFDADGESRYVRGCSGFTGFEQGQLSRERIDAFSARMDELIGREKWAQWGSEQVTSNYMAANARDTLVLPVDRYPFWAPGLDIDSAALVHFFGTFRFSEGMYGRRARALCEALSK